MKFAKNQHKKHKRKQSRTSPSMSAKADRHQLYELAVQDVSHEYDFINKTFREIRGYNAHTLREDFCGTAKMCCEWVRKSDKNTAVGVDIDADDLTSPLTPKSGVYLKLSVSDTGHGYFTPLLAHGMIGIGAQVNYYLVHLSRVGQHRPAFHIYGINDFNCRG